MLLGFYGGPCGQEGFRVRAEWVYGLRGSRSMGKKTGSMGYHDAFSVLFSGMQDECRFLLLGCLEMFEMFLLFLFAGIDWGF